MEGKQAKVEKRGGGKKNKKKKKRVDKESRKW